MNYNTAAAIIVIVDCCSCICCRFKRFPDTISTSKKYIQFVALALSLPVLCVCVFVCECLIMSSITHRYANSLKTHQLCHLNNVEKSNSVTRVADRIQRYSSQQKKNILVCPNAREASNWTQYTTTKNRTHTQSDAATHTRLEYGFDVCPWYKTSICSCVYKFNANFFVRSKI